MVNDFLDVWKLSNWIHFKECDMHAWFSDTETVMLDLDDMPFTSVKYWAYRILKWFHLEGFMVLKSSLNSYHVVFNRKVDWRENMKIVAYIVINTHFNESLNMWFVMQCRKGLSTLRVSSKGDKKSPRIVFRYGEQDGQINEFLQYQSVIKSIIRKTS